MQVVGLKTKLENMAEEGLAYMSDDDKDAQVERASARGREGEEEERARERERVQDRR